MYARLGFSYVVMKGDACAPCRGRGDNQQLHKNVPSQLEKHPREECCKTRPTWIRFSENLPDTGKIKRKKDSEEGKSLVCSDT